MKRIRRGTDETYIYYWQPRKRGFVGIRVSRENAWVIVGDAIEPEQLLVIGPGPAIPIDADTQTQEFRDIRREVAAVHPELEKVLTGELSFDKALLTGRSD